MNKFDQYHKDNPTLAKSYARKLYRHLKVSALELLKAEAKQAKGRDKMIGKRYIRILDDKL